MGTTSSRQDASKSDGRRGVRRAKKSDGEKRLFDSYDVGEMLGQGSFGVVYACSPIGKDGDYAVKMVDKVETSLNKIREETDMLMRFDSACIIKCHDVIYEKCFVCIVMDRWHGGDLIVGMQTHWKQHGKIHTMTTVHITAQMSAAVTHLHSNEIIHRDIKGDNYLLDRPDIDPHVKVVLTDFGTATSCKSKERLHELCGTKLYWSPEFCSADYSLKADVWAMGVIVFGLLNAKFPFRNERDIKTKNVAIPKDASKECKEFLMLVLERNEEKRLGHNDLVVHPWIAGEVIESDPQPIGGAGVTKIEVDPDSDLFREGGANDAVKNRRQELIARLHDAKTVQQGLPQIKYEHYWKEWFVVEERHSPGTSARYDWWAPVKVNQTPGLLPQNSVPASQNGQQTEHTNPALIGKQLEEHGIDTTKFGQGKAKSLQQLAKEVQNGSAILMLDAAEHKKMVRVVDIVLLRICAPGSTTNFLLETAEEFPDGRSRNLIRLPGTKKQPHMNAKQTADKIVDELLNMDVSKISFDFTKKEVFEEQEESPSYPGVETVYRKEIIEGRLKGDPTDDYIGKNAKPKTWFHQDLKGNIKYFAWMSEDDCIDEDVDIRAPAEAEEVSGLVHAPMGLDEDALVSYLEENNIDINKYGRGEAKTLRDFSVELINGESSLVLSSASSGVLKRVADVVILKLIHSVTKNVLVQTERTFTDGVKKAKPRLPGQKRRSDENHFLTAKRIIKQELQINENHVVLDVATEVAEEEMYSENYPGLLTTYRKIIITATLAKEGAEFEPMIDDKFGFCCYRGW